METRKVMFLGASGTGKTTLAKMASEKLGIPFISSSLSDLSPETKEEHHKIMMEKSSFRQEMKFLSLRYKHIASQNGSFITDRSFIDNLAYMLLKLGKEIAECDFDTFRDTVVKCFEEAGITHVVYIPVTLDMINVGWEVEDNNKRILNPYFQYMVSSIMTGIIPLLGEWDQRGAWDVKHDSTYQIFRETGLKLLVLEEFDIQKRINLINSFLSWQS